MKLDIGHVLFSDIVDYSNGLIHEERPTATGEVRCSKIRGFKNGDGAIAALEQLMAAPCDAIFGPPMTPALLRLDPDFDSLRGNPRFEKLCQEKKL